MEKNQSNKDHSNAELDQHLVDLSGLNSVEVHEDHVDERWLISYADMMTLLFGLFVMLYAIAMETQGRPESVFSDLNQAGASNPAEKFKSILDLENENKKLAVSLLTSEQNLKKLNSAQVESEQKLKGLLAESESHKAMISQLQGQLNQYQHQAGKRLPSGQEAKITQEVALLKSQVAEKNRQIASLMKDTSGSFLVIALKWETEKHDLDLVVTDPGGRRFNFEKREYKDISGKFVIDSRSGPGVEMWQSTKLSPGLYQAEFNFYNSYGNAKPAVVSGSIITKKGEFPIQPFKLDFSKQKSRLFKIQANIDGSIEIK